MATKVVNTHEAKSRLSELIRDAEGGVDVIVARNGRPVAKIVPWKSDLPERTPGLWSGLVKVSGAGAASDDDVTSLFDASAARDVL